jgi:hypothetical protein
MNIKESIKKQFNRVITYKNNGYTFIRGSMIGYGNKPNLIWNENIDKDGYHYSFLNMNNNNIKLKNDVININNWLNYCNYNYVHEISIYMQNPNLNSLLKYLQPVKEANEELNIRNISISNCNILYNFYTQNNIMNNDIKLKNKYNNEIYGLRTINLLSFYIDKKNYNQNKILSIINSTKHFGLKPLYIYNNIDIVKDDTLKYKFTKIYNYNFNILEIEPSIFNIFIKNKVEHFNKLLNNCYGNIVDCYIGDYTLNIYIKFDHIISEYENENIINKLNESIFILEKMDICKLKLKFNIYFPKHIRILLKSSSNFIKIY